MKVSNTKLTKRLNMLFVKQFALAVFVITVCRYGVVVAETFEENSKFCIRTQPMLLADVEKQKSIIDDNEECEIVATTLTVNEKESLLSTMCKDHGGSHKDIFYLLKLHNGDLVGRGTYHELCDSKTNPLLAWVPYELMQKNYAQELNPKERLNYMAKATDVSREKTELCHFRHSDLVNKIPDNLFTCVVMIFEDNFYGLDSNINVLVEIEPLMYELRNLTYMPWINSTMSYKTLLGKTFLKNPSRERKQIYGNHNYEFVEKVELNLSTVYSNEMLRLPLLFEHKNAVLKLDVKGVGGMVVKERAYFGRKMNGRTKVKVDLIGQWAEHRQQFSADIYEYFGYGVKRFHNEMHNGDVKFVRVESTEPVYEVPEGDDIVVPNLHSLDGKRLERITVAEDTFSKDNETEIDDIGDLDIFADGIDEDIIEFPLDRETHPYPDFYPWFIVAVLVVGAVILAALYGIVRSYSNKEDRKKYKFTGI